MLRFQVSISASSSRVETRLENLVTWKDSSGRKEETFDSTGVSIPRRLRRSLSAPYRELRSTTGHGKPSIFHPQEGMERHAGKWRSIISDGEVPTQSRRRGGFHEKPLTTSTSVRLNVLLVKKRAISCDSSEDTPVQTVVWRISSPTGYCPTTYYWDETGGSIFL